MTILSDAKNDWINRILHSNGKLNTENALLKAANRRLEREAAEDKMTIELLKEKIKGLAPTNINRVND